MAWLLVTLTCLTVYRVTRLLVSDKITEVPRDKVILWAWRRAHPNLAPSDYVNVRSAPMLAYFVTCPWCTSIWLGAVIVGTLWLTSDIPYPLLVWPASSAITGLLATKED
jgi:hypothetical protein